MYIQKIQAMSSLALMGTIKFSSNNNYHNHLLQTGFLDVDEAIVTSLIPVLTTSLLPVLTTSLLPVLTNFPEICAVIIGFSCTVWTKMSPLLAHQLMVC